jgi:hypothetical protein
MLRGYIASVAGVDLLGLTTATLAATDEYSKILRSIIKLNEK